MKRTILVALVVCFAFAAVGYAERSPEELALNMAVLKVDTGAKRAMPATIEVFPVLNGEEEMPCFPNVTSEQEIPRWQLGLINR
jgi:hypothetical protein